MDREKVNAYSLQAKKKKGERITMLTAYDYPLARIIDQAGIDIVFVSDALGMTGLGYKSTLPLTMEEMLHHIRAVRRGVERAFVLACMPFMEYSTECVARKNAGGFVKEGGADGVEVEGGWEVVKIAGTLTEAGIPTMVHIGLHASSYPGPENSESWGKPPTKPLILSNWRLNAKRRGHLPLIWSACLTGSQRLLPRP
jgi:3-methyl-2-oxobutanoate hydroxymethyltransferase